MNNIYYQDLTPQDREILERLYFKFRHNDLHYAGYPPNTQFDYSELYDFLQFAINNLGDPFTGNNARSTHPIECEVLRFFAELTDAPENFCGYITNGSTEGNLYGLYLARKQYPEGIAYFSSHAHYSVPKNLDILNMPFVAIPSLENGEINYQILEKEMTKRNNKPVITVATLGSVVTGAIDDIAKIKTAIKNANVKEYFIHADAALSGMVLPFVDQPQPFKFSDGIDSITISGHKFIGAPIPCGVALTKHSHVERIRKFIKYVDKPDVTISGSRNGITPLFLWYAIKRMGKNGFQKAVHGCFKKVQNIMKQMEKHGINAWHNKNSLAVVVPAPSKKFFTKWNTPCAYGYTQIIALPKTTEAMVNEFCHDLKQDLSGKDYCINENDKLIYDLGI